MVIHHLNCATMCPPFGRLVNAQKHMVCHCLLVETNDGLVLVDTGIGTPEVSNPKPLGRLVRTMTGPKLDLAETAIAQVEALGFSAADVRHIVVTHLDFDHAGGLPDFPDAQVHVYTPELEAALAYEKRHRMRYYPHQWAHEPSWVRHEPDGESWKGFESVRAVGGTDDEVLIVPVVGHSPGHAAIAVKHGDGWLLHCGDAYFHADEMNVAHPSCSFGLKLFQRVVQADGEARKRNQRRLRELKAGHDDVRLFCAHDPTELEAFAAL